MNTLYIHTRGTSPHPPTWPTGTPVAFRTDGVVHQGHFLRRYTPAPRAGVHYDIEMPDGEVATLFANGATGLTVTPQRAVAWNRPEREACQRGTPGCSIDHDHDLLDSCETW